MEYNLRHNPPTPRNNIGEKNDKPGGNYLPPIDNRHLRKLGEIILSKEMNRNNEPVRAGHLATNGSQATLK